MTREEFLTDAICVRCARSKATLVIPAANGSNDAVCESCSEPSRRDSLISLINTYNESSSPSVPRTDAEHAIERERAKIALGSIKRNYMLGVDYKELSNGALWPIN